MSGTEPVSASIQEKSLSVDENQAERLHTIMDMEYANEDEEPELHARTYIALAAMFLLNFVQVLALLGPPAGVRTSLPPSEVHHGLPHTQILRSIIN